MPQNRKVSSYMMCPKKALTRKVYKEKTSMIRTAKLRWSSTSKLILQLFNDFLDLRIVFVFIHIFGVLADILKGCHDNRVLHCRHKFRVFEKGIKIRHTPCCSTHTTGHSSGHATRHTAHTTGHTSHATGHPSRETTGHSPWHTTR